MDATRKDDKHDGRSQYERAVARSTRQARKLLASPLVPSYVKTTPMNVRRHGS